MCLGLACLTLVGCDTRRFLNGWAPYWMATSSTETFSDGAEVFEEVSPFWYQATTDAGTITPNATTTPMAPLRAAAEAEGVPVLPSITDGHPEGELAAILADPASRTEHVQAIVDLVMAEGYDGIDLDYEGFAFRDDRSTWAATAPNWVAFVKELGAQLHRREKLLTVTVPPIWAGGSQGYTVYSWARIAPHVDRLRIMTYDWSFGTPGPGAPIWWVRDVLDHAADVVPISKVELGVGVYGREWTATAVGTCPADQVPGMVSHTLRAIPAVIAASGATPTRDARSGEMTFSYTRRIETHLGDGRVGRTPRVDGTADTIGRYAVPTVGAVRLGVCVITREVWYPDARALAARAKAALGAGAGVTVWALGFENPSDLSALGGVGAGLTGPAGTAPMGALESTTKAGATIVASGWAFEPEGDLPIPVRVTVTAPDGSTRSTTVLARSERLDVASAHPGAGEFHGFTVRVSTGSTAPSGRYRVCATAAGRYTATPDTAIGCRRVTFP